jgi:hypothetical protein
MRGEQGSDTYMAIVPGCGSADDEEGCLLEHSVFSMCLEFSDEEGR